MPSTVTKVSQRKTLDVVSHALASTQVFYHDNNWWFVFFVDCTSDVRWAGEEDLIADAKLLSLKRDYLMIRENRLKNIAFNANATDGGSDQNEENRFSQFVSETILPYDLQVVLVGIGSATYDKIEYDLTFTMEGALGLSGALWVFFQDSLFSAALGSSTTMQSTLASPSLTRGRHNVAQMPYNLGQQNY